MPTNIQHIGILGSGRVATVLARKLNATGHTVILGSRNIASVAEHWAGTGVKVQSPQDCVQQADLVVNATPGDTSVQHLGALRDGLAGKTLLDPSNASLRGPDGLPQGLMYPGSSVAEQLQAALPETRVVKALNTMFYTVMADPHSLGTPPTAFLSGNGAEALTQVRAVLSALGWPSEWVEDLGDLTTARATEAMVLMAPALLRNHGFAPFALGVAR